VLVGPVSERGDRFVGPRLVYPTIPKSVPDELALADARTSTPPTQGTRPIGVNESPSRPSPGVDKRELDEPKAGLATSVESIATTARDAQDARRVIVEGSSNLVSEVESKGDARVLGLVVEASPPITPSSFTGSLALTGASSLLLGLIALVLLLAGSAVLKLTKRS
jgi:hypothetical protein